MTSGHHEARRAVVIRRLGCGDPRCGFARIRCPDFGYERLLMFSCHTREEQSRSRSQGRRGESKAFSLQEAAGEASGLTNPPAATEARAWVRKSIDD